MRASRARTVAFCAYCGANLQADDKFCPGCGQPVGQGAAGPPSAKPKRSSLWLWLIPASVVLAFVAGVVGLVRLGEKSERQPQESTPDLSTSAVYGILVESYMPNPVTMEEHSSRENIFAGHWLSFREAQSRCGSGNCYYLSFRFDTIDAQGTSHEVECEWDIDATRRTATPRNPQARYYWTHK